MLVDRDEDGRDGERAANMELDRLAVDAAPGGMVIVDGGGRVLRLNRAAEALLGRTRDQALGASIDQLLPPAAPVASEVVTLHHGDGAERAVEVTRTPLGAQGARLISLVDVTERQHEVRELRRSNAELEQLAHVASHDLQEPLRMVASYTELLARRYQGQLDDKADRYIHHAVDGARRMQRLVADLLAYARVESQATELAPVALGAVVERVREMFASRLREAQATVEVRPLPTVAGDADQLFQLFQNLIGNAMKFRAAPPLVIAIDAAPEASGWRISVADNGIGIDPQHAARIFQMFQRLHPRSAYDGSGVGLALVKRIVERHRGRIWVASEPGRGATFHFTLPPVDAVGAGAPAPGAGGDATADDAGCTDGPTRGELPR